MEAKSLLYACVLGLILVVCVVESSPIDRDTEQELLKRAMYKLDADFEDYLRNKAPANSLGYAKRNEGNLFETTHPESQVGPFKRENPKTAEKRSNLFDISNPDGPIGIRSLKQGQRGISNPDGPIGIRSLKQGQRGKRFDISNPDGPIGIRSLKQRQPETRDVDRQLSETRVQNLMRYLAAEMERNVDKRDHE